ncbi:MAG TPA: protein kinase [Thermoanaerobaculia bacterium]|nr:protein kinase [Thermoanaerobaculia bacterium]
MVPPDTDTVPPLELPSPAPTLPVGSVIDDRYEVRSVLGTGGHAVVYRAWDRVLRRETALKVLRSDRIGPGTLSRFRREARVARDVSGPRLVRIFDVGTSGDTVYLTMEVVEGESLRECLRQGALPVGKAVSIASGILEGLAALHALGIVHRDVKPGNVLLGSDGGVKLVDFGLARLPEPDQTRATDTGHLLGTIEYVSPEQALGETVDARSDLYSLGVVLFEMLTGRLPYQGRSGLGTLLARLQNARSEARRLPRSVPRWLASIVERLLEREPRRRYPSAEAVLRDLRSRRPIRLSRRRLAAALLLALALPVVWLAVLASRPRFDHLEPLGERGLRALDADGNVLWSLQQAWLGRNVVMATLEPGGPRRLVGIPGIERGPRDRQVLSVFDLDTGRVVKRISLPSGAEFFPAFSDRYGHDVKAQDLDGDGGDELFVSYTHDVYWPTYIVLHEPRIDRSRVLFVGSGLHRVAGFQDLDGDNRPEVLITGINNLMGWSTVLAAVRVEPGINELPEDMGVTLRAFSPETPYAHRDSGLLWYALARRERLFEPPLRIDPLGRTLELSYADGSRLVLGFDGFPPGSSVGDSSETRQEARRRAYQELREAGRLLTGGFAEAALTHCVTGIRRAGEAHDARLREWALRFHGRVLGAAGRVTEADALFRGLAARSEAVSDIAYDAGRSLHLAGVLELAIDWYRRGLGPGGSNEAGRFKYELLEGQVLAAVELGWYEQVLQEIDAFQAAYPDMAAQGPFYREYVHWRSGRIPSPGELEPSHAVTDLFRYWHLEFRAAQERSPEVLRRLLAETEEALSEVSGTPGMLLSFRGELLARMGRTSEAVETARRAVEALRPELTRDYAARGHFDLAVERYASLLEDQGASEKAATARREVDRVRIRRAWKGE